MKLDFGTETELNSAKSVGLLNFQNYMGAFEVWFIDLLVINKSGSNC